MIKELKTNYDSENGAYLFLKNSFYEIGIAHDIAT